MASLQGNTIKDTYKSLLKVADNGELEATAQEITDGNGNGTGVSLNTSGDVTATGTVAFGSLKDSGENITITKFVDEADGIANNDNDSTIPTSAAVRDYVDSNITAQDLDITDGVNVGAVDLDSQSLIFTGDAGVSATVSGQTVTFNSSALQNQIDSNDSDISGLDGRLVTAENKLATIETNADVTDVTNVTTALNSISVTELNDVTSAGSGAIITTNERNKLAGIEAGAEVNPTAGEIKTLYESNADTNAFTDAQLNKLNGIESGAEVNTVDSVNTQTGAVVLDADDIDDSATTNKFTTQAEIDKLAGIESGAQVNTVDSVNGATGVVVLDADDIDDTSTTNKFVTSSDVTKLSNITITQAVDLDTLESDVSANTSKLAGIENGADVTDATNVAAAGAMMTDVALLNDLADVSGTPTDGQVLTYDSVNGWQPEDGGGGAVDSVNGQTGVVVLDADDIDDSTTTNKFTTQAEIDKLAGIEAGADVTDAANVTTALGSISVTAHSDVTSAGSGDIITTIERDKLAGIEAGAEVNTVDSVNTQTGAVVLDADDIDDTSTTNKFTTQSDIDKLAGIEAGAQVNTVDSVNSQTGVVVLDADDIDDTSTTNKFTTQTDIDKLAGIEALADVTDAANVAAAGALMDGTAQLSDLIDVSSATPTDGQILTYDTVNGWQPEDSQGSDYTVQEISTNTTAVKNNLYVFTASLTLTLPASPSVGDKVGIANQSGTNTPVVARNGNLLIGIAEDLTIDVQNIAVEFIYSGATEGWIMFADAIYGAASTGGGGGTIDGSGTANKIAKWSDSDTLTDSVIYDSGTRIGISTSSPTALIESYVVNTGAIGASNNANIALGSNGAIDTRSIMTFGKQIDGGYAPAFMGYITTDDTGESKGDIFFGTRSVTTDFPPTERMRILSSGGITFNGDTAAANALDDYEEATWTPNDQSDASLTFTSVSGHYTKIGNLVTATFAVTYPSNASGSSARISLPFTSVLGDGNTGFHPTFTNSGVTLTGITVSTFIQLYTYSGVLVSNSSLSGSTLRGTITFYV
jgi:hypothetical protein